ncbi:MAG TPA: hypothetical protein DCZ94_09090 [Lentisphaeria bacterium]|nr:MAG: hypothetical protein A2X48_18550 [Lentisphaerae bacterium GWF2_49_21]HBC87095.1 hypothetical protein [Lentisphaeria bacterium]
MMSRQNILLIAVFAVLFILITFAAIRGFSRKAVSDFYHPYFSTAGKVSDAASYEALVLEGRHELASKVQKLQEENDILAAKMNILGSLKRENLELRELVGIGKIPFFTCVTAEVIKRDPAAWYEKLIVNKGGDDGIREGSIVISKLPRREEGGPSFAVIGRVKSVSNHEALISTIMSEECALSVLVSGSKAHGVAGSGRKTGRSFIVKIKYLPRDVVYTPGEYVYTSGLSGLTPSSLLIGRLAEEKEGQGIKIKDNLYAEIWMEPSANFDNLRFVLIMVPEKEK